MTLTVFLKDQVVARGAPEQVVPRMRALQPLERTSDLLAFDDETGRQIDLDLRPEAQPVPRRGRPALGVEAKEVTLLPRHWEWLGTQPGGASVALRKLVEAARRANGDADRARAARDAAYRFMSVMAGNLAGFEEASRALFADDRRRFVGLIAGWPDDIRDHIVKLAFSDRADP
jgi:hypothetical protein